MSVNYGKAFEERFKTDFLKTVPGCTVDRLYDQVTGFKYTSSNISDYICYSYPNEFYIECKSVHGASFPFSNLSQYEKLKTRVGIPGVRAGVVIWFIDHDSVQYVPCSTITELKDQGKKSINYQLKDKEDVNIIEIPSVKKRVFMESDYSILLSLKEGD